MMTESNSREIGSFAPGFDLAGLPAYSSFAVATVDQTYDNFFKEAEKALLHPRAVPSRQQAFWLGRAAAHGALQQLGRDEGPILSGTGREPLWPPGIAGSISHTVEVGVALVAPLNKTDGVGIDIEQRRPVPELYGQVPRPEEQSWLENSPADKRDDLILTLFSAKECIFKAFYPRVGDLFGFEAASLTPTPAGFSARMVTDLDSDYPEQRSFEVGCEWRDDHVLSWLILPSS